jgi:4-oxalomesaconate tautomerase
MLPGSPAAALARIPAGEEKLISVEHPIGETSVVMQVSDAEGAISVHKAAILRTARKLFEGVVYAS